MRRDGRVVDGGGLENRCTRKGTGGSNPSLSASLACQREREPRLATPAQVVRRSAKVDIRRFESLGQAALR